MPEEQDYQSQLNEARNQDAQPPDDNEDNEEPAAGQSAKTSASFPFGLLALAGFFDLLGLIPILNIFTDLLAGLILWFWQKSYVPSFDPMLNIFTNKIIDICTLGIFPSNMGIVIVAFIKKRAVSKTTPAESGTPEPATGTA